MTKALPIRGLTTDGKKVVGGIFSFCETYGVSLDVVLEEIRNAGYMPDWCDLYLECLRAGINKERTLIRISDAMIDAAWEVNIRDKIIKQLRDLGGTNGK
jgi:hypothetical protein